MLSISVFNKVSIKAEMLEAAAVKIKALVSLVKIELP